MLGLLGLLGLLGSPVAGLVILCTSTLLEMVSRKTLAEMGHPSSS